MTNRISQLCLLCAALMSLSGCSTMNDMITSSLPESHSGRPSIVVSLQAQEAYLYRGTYRMHRRGYRVVVKDTARLLVAFRLSVRTKIIGPASMVTMLMIRAKW